MHGASVETLCLVFCCTQKPILYAVDGKFWRIKLNRLSENLAADKRFDLCFQKCVHLIVIGSVWGVSWKALIS